MTEIKKIYISGKITGTDDYMERFARAEKDLKKKFPEAEIINPARVNAELPKSTTYDQYMEMSMLLLKMCDTICMLNDWHCSDGAIAEYGFACCMKKKIVRQYKSGEFYVKESEE